MNTAWLFLLYSLSTRHSSERVSLWRALKKFGALPLKTSAYVLPDEPVHHERLQWLAQRVRDSGGEATLMRVTEIEGLTHEQIVQLFNEARAQEYAELNKALSRFVKRNRSRRAAAFAGELDKFNTRFKEIRAIDYFDCPKAHDVEMLLGRAGELSNPKSKSA
ncbi:MAG: hypothetical protein HY300_00505, partial [Verrucomicrobia bacterium]|nr:hypothetical protein [Verrucomicrobiota bacterium]